MGKGRNRGDRKKLRGTFRVWKGGKGGKKGETEGRSRIDGPISA
jgi:hypothetical protein